MEAGQHDPFSITLGETSPQLPPRHQPPPVQPEFSFDYNIDGETDQNRDGKKSTSFADALATPNMHDCTAGAG